MKVSTLGKNKGSKTPAYSGDNAAKKTQQHQTPSQKRAKTYKSLVKSVALNYKAKNMNPAFANKAGRATAGMIMGDFARYHRVKSV